MVSSSIVKIGGKTGTAQVVSKNKASSGERFQDHAWFVAVAPVEHPEVAVAVFVEHGMHGGSAAGPIAKKSIEAYYTNKKKAEQALKTAAPDKTIQVQKDTVN